MKIYLAGKWSEKHVAREKMNDLEKLGHTITHDWTSYESDPDNSLQDMADHDVNGVMSADAYIGTFDDPKYAYRGTFTELGVALTTKRLRPSFKIYAVCPKLFTYNNGKDDNKDDGTDKPYYSTNCFFHASGIEYVKSWENLIKILEISPDEKFEK